MNIQGISVSALTLESIVGVDAETLMRHIESTFTNGMTWSNMDQWDLDHITPLYIFDLELAEERVLAFHYSNLTARWAAEHTEKSIDDMLPLRVRQKHFLEHIERNFLPGMSWENTSEWFIDTDHGTKDFNLLKPSERRKFFHYKNYVPRWRSH
jgi:hypothetical protein